MMIIISIERNKLGNDIGSRHSFYEMAFVVIVRWVTKKKVLFYGAIRAKIETNSRLLWAALNKINLHSYFYYYVEIC